MKNKLLHLAMGFLLLLGFRATTTAQISCGTAVTQEIIDIEKSWIAKKKLKSYSSSTPDKINRTLEITAYILNKDSSLLTELDDTIKAVNKFFAPIGLSFKICKYVVAPHIFFANSNDKIRKESSVAFYNTNTINMYFVDSLIRNYPAPKAPKEVCGFASMNYTNDPKNDYVYISSKGQCLSVATISHELGHFMGLYHTHEFEDFGIELADSSNCSTSGDLICDTPADPDLTDHVDSQCQYTGYYSYTPPVSNIMSYSLPKCYCGFTLGQYKRMVEFYYMYLQRLR